MTSRGMKEEDMDVIAEAITTMLKEGESGAEKAKRLVKGLTDQYPLL